MGEKLVGFYVLIRPPKADIGNCMSIRLISWLNRFSSTLVSVDSKKDMGAAKALFTRIL
jgi:hypothetical protein